MAEELCVPAEEEITGVVGSDALGVTWGVGWDVVVSVAAVGDPVLDVTGGLVIDTLEVGVDEGMGWDVAVVGDPVLDVTGG